MTDIYVSKPNFWWRADAGRIQEYVPFNPDVEDGHQRWPDRDDQRWDLVAQAVIQVSRALAAGEWEPDEEDGRAYGLIRIDADELTRTEKKIVRAWFGAAQPVRVDPWFEPLQDGRHRLWATLEAFGTELVPIKGDAVGYANHLDTEMLGKDWPTFFEKNLEDLAAVTWFDAADPVNIRFADALKSAARGAFPAPV